MLVIDTEKSYRKLIVPVSILQVPSLMQYYERLYWSDQDGSCTIQMVPDETIFQYIYKLRPIWNVDTFQLR